MQPRMSVIAVATQWSKGNLRHRQGALKRYLRSYYFLALIACLGSAQRSILAADKTTCRNALPFRHCQFYHSSGAA